MPTGGRRRGRQDVKSTPDQTKSSQIKGSTAPLGQARTRSHTYSVKEGRANGHFSLLDEAHHTESHSPGHAQGRLRHSRVAFASAGSLSNDVAFFDTEISTKPQAVSKPIRGLSGGKTQGEYQTRGKPGSHDEFINEDSRLQPAHLTGNSVLPHHQSYAGITDVSKGASAAKTSPLLDPENNLPKAELVKAKMGSEPADDVLSFDAGSESVSARQSFVTARYGPFDDASSDEEIVFQGRHAKTALTGSAQKHNRPSETIASASLSHPRESSVGRKGTVRRKSRDLLKCPADGDAAVDDYLANLEGNIEDHFDLGDISASVRDLGGFDDWQSMAEILENEGKMQDVWESDQIEDFKDLSTSSEKPDQVWQILARRERKSGYQYLIVGIGSTIDDAKWLPEESLAKSPDTARLLQQFESDRLRSGHLSERDDSDSSDVYAEQIERDLQEALDGAEDKSDPGERRIAGSTDEQLAKLFSKQEDLGIISSDLVLFGGEDAEFSFDRHADIRPSNSRAKKSSGQGRHRRLDLRTRKATKYGAMGTDILETDLDWQMPRKRSNPRGVAPEFGLSDSELEQSLRSSWEKDRLKKKARKQEREEFRAQGLLGRKRKGKPDLKAKYSGGMKIEQVKVELQQFLESADETMSLPPMDPNARKIVHEICHKLAIRSKSMGSGQSRFPVLYKTARTQPFTQTAFAHIRRGYFPPLSKGKNGAMAVPRVPRARAGKSGAYLDGEVVGAGAPELDQTNRGRAMLEKMGWSTGAALGAAHNPGIVVPVAQVVKNSRAGLG